MKKQCNLKSCQYELTDLWQEVALESRWFGAYGSSSQSMKMVSQSSFTNPMWTIQEAPFFGSYMRFKMCSTLSSACPKETHTGSKATSNNTSQSLSSLLLFIQAWTPTMSNRSSSLHSINSQWNKKTRMGARSNLQVVEDRNFSLLHFATNNIQATDWSCSIQALPCCRTKTKTPEV